MYIKKYQNKNENMPKAYNKWYGRVVHTATIDTEGLARHIMEHGSIYTDDVVLGVTRKMMHCIAELLQDGYKVKLDGIGTLYITCKSTGTYSRDEFSVANIKSLRTRFLADQSTTSLYSKSALRRVKVSTDMGKYQEEGNESGEEQQP